MSAFRPRLGVAVVLVLALVIQTTFGSDLRILGVAPDLMLLMAISAGLVCGPNSGAIIGFVAGLLADLAMTTTPLGLYALCWCVVGWVVGTLRAYVLPDARVVRPAIAFLATVGAVLVFLVVGSLVGQTELTVSGRTFLVKVLIVEGLWNAVLVVPATMLLGAMARGLPGVVALGRVDPVPSR